MREVCVELCRTRRFHHDGQRSQHGPHQPARLTLIPEYWASEPRSDHLGSVRVFAPSSFMKVPHGWT